MDLMDLMDPIDPENRNRRTGTRELEPRTGTENHWDLGLSSIRIRDPLGFEESGMDLTRVNSPEPRTGTGTENQTREILKSRPLS